MKLFKCVFNAFYYAHYDTHHMHIDAHPETFLEMRLACALHAFQKCASRKTYQICIRCVSKMRIMVVPFYAHLKTHLKRIIDAH